MDKLVSSKFVEFVGNKPIDTKSILEAMAPSIAQNRHTNFGPVVDELERVLLALNGGNPHRSACATASATLGLQAVVATFDNTNGRRLKWAVNDFGFFTSFAGPFHDQLRVPCEANGMISLKALERVPTESYDAILATNVFGLHEDFTALFDFARANQKALLIDNAAGFRALAPYHTKADADDPLLWAEVVSFHHTKPWGMGEGGAVFLPESMKETCRAAINFGVGGGRQLKDTRLCTNGKMSEIAAAQTLLRVQAVDSWEPGHRQQAERLLRLGRIAGLKPLVSILPARAVAGQIPFLSNQAVTYEQLDNPVFRILKYYRPSVASGEVAHSLFRHILNVPCHSEMATLSDDDILGVLRSIQDGS